ncbi:hypothetical protein HK098_007328 [Nowakowskiella sp. JEL0407]|nr:hypothetical protein HK098_007328 [Nowakowskiella sp. JEL0407]
MSEKSNDNPPPAFTIDGVVESNTANDPSDPPPIYAARNKPKESRNCRNFFTKRNIIISVVVLVVVILIAVLVPLYATGNLSIPSTNQDAKYYPNVCDKIKIHNGTYSLSISKMQAKEGKAYILCEFSGKEHTGGAVVELDIAKNQTQTIYTSDVNFVDLAFAKSVLGDNTDRLYSANINGSIQYHNISTLTTTKINLTNNRKNQTLVTFIPYLSRTDLFVNKSLGAKTDFDEKFFLTFVPDSIANETSFSSLRGMQVYNQTSTTSIGLWQRRANDSIISDITNYTIFPADLRANPLRMLLMEVYDNDLPFVFGYPRVYQRDDIYLTSVQYSPHSDIPLYLYFQRSLSETARKQNDPVLVTNARCPFNIASLLHLSYQNEQSEAYYATFNGTSVSSSGHYNTSASARIFAVGTDSTGTKYALVEFFLSAFPMDFDLAPKLSIKSCRSISMTRGTLQDDSIAMKMEGSLLGKERSLLGEEKPGKVSIFVLSWENGNIQEWDGNRGNLKTNYVLPKFGYGGETRLKVSGSNLFVATANDVFVFDIK